MQAGESPAPSADRAPADDPARRGRAIPISVNAVLNAGGNVAYAAAVALVTPIALHFLGEAAWGVWQLVGAATSYALLLNIGLNSSVSFYVSRSVAAGESERLSASIHNARIFFWTVGGAIGAMGLLGSRAYAATFVDPELLDLGFLALAASMGITAVTLPVRIYPSVLSGIQRYDLLGYFRIASGVALLVSAALAFQAGMGLVGFAVLMSVAPAAPAFFAWLASRRLMPGDALAWRSVDRPHLAAMVRYSLNTLGYVAGTVVLYQSMKLIAALRCGGAAAAGHMGLVVNLVQLVSVAFLPLAAVLHTRVADLSARGLDEQLPTLIRKTLAGVGVLAVPSIAFLVVEADTVFRAWVGGSLDAGTIDRLAATTRLMLLGQGVYVVFLPCFYALVGVGDHRLFGIGMVVTGAMNALAGWLATGPAPRIETLGAVFGVCLAALVLLVTAPLAIRRFALGALQVARETVAVPMLLALPGLAVLAVRPRFADPLADLALAAVCFGLPSLPALWWGRRRVQGTR
ncbi:MAG: lipopolysaccharide biosynthesis protein [Myxococcota bacterium]